MTTTIEHYINDQRVSRDDRYQDVYNPATGDCRQELVFIGQNIDFVQMRAELDACLLNDEEMALEIGRASCRERV